ERFAAYGDETFRQVAARTGLPLELLLVIREAMGSAEARPDDRLRLDELNVVPMLHFMMGLGSRGSVVEGFIRVLGESLRRAAETEGDWWRSEVIPRFGDQGPTYEQLVELLGHDISRSSDEALLAIYRGQQANAWLKNIFEGFGSSLVAAGLHTRDEHPPAMCFLDLTGYTRLTDERGDTAAAELASRLGRIVQRTSGQHGGRPVKWLGDGVMFHFREPGPAVLAALEMVESGQKEGLPPARVGLHAGPVLFREGDYFGRTVNVAARIADYARQGEVLVSQEVVDASNGHGLVFAEIGAVELKGLTETVRLHIAHRGPA
ncbi:MAG: adenylate cyclase, partial [Chloroflexota bacterium]|nr:adenylate cyclase [Chloroflexota bacterium]